jgi:hypothetical protein
MTDEVESLVLEQLRRIRAVVERTELDVMDVKSRMSSLEIAVGQHSVLLGNVGVRLDRLDERVGRIERRLDLVEA